MTHRQHEPITIRTLREKFASATEAAKAAATAHEHEPVIDKAIEAAFDMAEDAFVQNRDLRVTAIQLGDIVTALLDPNEAHDVIAYLDQAAEHDTPRD